MSKLAADFRSFMAGSLSLESAVVTPPSELSDDLPLDPSIILEIREDRNEVEEELESLIEADAPEVGSANINQTVGAVMAISDAAPAVDSVTADAFVPVANASLESISRILQIHVPRLNQELNGQISLESLDSLRDWVGQAASSFKASAKNFFARIALWWRRLFVTVERMRKRLNSIRARVGSRKGTGGKDLKLGKYAAGLVQGDGFSSDPLAAMNAEAELNTKLAQILLGAQGGIEQILTSRLDQLLGTDRPASAMFRADLSKVLSQLEAAIKQQPAHLLGNKSIMTEPDDGDYMIVVFNNASPNPEQVAKNSAPLRSLTPEQVMVYLDAVDVLLDSAMSTIRGIEKESMRILKTAETAVERVGSKYTIDREMMQETVDGDGRPTYVSVTETTSTIGRVMETEYEIVEVINGLSWTINVLVARTLYTASSVLTLAEESVIQD